MCELARWRSGNAAVCKTAMRGFDSRPGLTRIVLSFELIVYSGTYAEVVELVDTRDLKSLGHCGRAGSNPALGTHRT